jgi:hypothetical protein
MDHVSNLPIPPAAAWAELTSEPFLRAFAEEVGVDVHDLTCTQDGGRESATMEWSFETDRPGIPELAKRFLPDDVHLTWSQWWDPLDSDAASGQIHVVLKGRPSATSTGVCQLVGADAGSSLTTSTRVKADLPFPVAGRVESLIDKELIGWIISVQARVLLRRSGG